MKIDRLVKGVTALLLGCAVTYLGDRLLGVRIELWFGLETFSFAWMLDVFVVPFVAGLLTAVAFGMGGKWLCYFPPLLVRLISYYSLAHNPDLMVMGYWGFFVILTMEAAAFGGILGEIMNKRTYGRSARETIYKGRAPVEDEGDS